MVIPNYVIKRNGEKIKFDGSKIEASIKKAILESYSKEDSEEVREKAKQLTDNLLEELNKVNKEELNVEEIQNIVEIVLMRNEPHIAKSYILYRNKHAELRKIRNSLGIPNDELKVPINTLIVLAARYLLKDENGKIIETPKQLFERVANNIAGIEKHFNASDEEISRRAQEYYGAMTEFKFMPNSPTLMNAGTKDGQLSACFVLPVGDSIPEIFDALKYQAMIHKTGGGTGFAFSRLRPANDFVKSTSGVASGAVSFMKIFDASTEQIKQGGKRRGANMGILRVDHPDILEFIVMKETEGTLRNFNISVGITEDFMKALQAGKEYNLINPRTGKVAGKLNAKAVWNLIITMSWKTGDPAMVFLDRINASYSNPVPSKGLIEATNPCGEQPLYPYDSCNLGSINLAKMVKRVNQRYEIDWEELKRITRLGTRFLDDVVEANHYPLPQIDEMTKSIRRIGLGVMGWADLLLKLGIKYDSNEALMLAEHVMKVITDTARKESEKLAEERGAFPEFGNSIWAKLGYKPLRNSTVTTIAPTGTISIIAGGCSQGIEPIFSVVYQRNVRDSIGSNLIETNNEFESNAIEKKFYTDELIEKLANKVSIQDVEEIPLNIRRLFVTAYDINSDWHIKMQAAFQKYTDNGVSKTINMPNQATPQDIEKAYMLAYQTGCKGTTIYRDGSKAVQVLGAVNTKQKGLDEVRNQHFNVAEDTLTMAAIIKGVESYRFQPTNTESCPECGTNMIAGSGCFTCTKCAYSKCG